MKATYCGAHQRFKIKKKISHAVGGGNGVWLCQDAAYSNETVVVKQVILDPPQQDHGFNCHRVNPFNERWIVRLLQECEHHENILTVRSEFTSKGIWFLVMEHCSGGDLLARLDRTPNQRFPERAALRIMRQVIDGVAFLHRCGVAHRDLSLENVLELNGVYKICDFGLATPTRQPRNDLVGKPYYMAPEVVSRTWYDPRAADVWSLGIMLFMLLTGSPLVPRASREDKTFLAVQRVGIENVLHAWGLALSPPTMDALTSMLQVDPQRRIPVDGLLRHAAFDESFD